MLRHLETKGYVPSRIGYPKKPKITRLSKSDVSLYRGRQWNLWWGMALLTGVYLTTGWLVQYVDPTSGWLDTGTLSLPLFAAWSCLVGYGVAGLLPVIWTQIGKKGGIEKWRSTVLQVATLVAYIAYIGLLCVLL